MNNEKQILNELGDTLKGKIKLLGYLNSRSKDLESLEKESKRLDNLKQTHMANIRRNRFPSNRVIDTLYNMGVKLTDREGRYRTGMGRAVRSLGLPFLREYNSTTIKEDYKQIPLNEIGETKRGREMLKRYIDAARAERSAAVAQGNAIQAEIPPGDPNTNEFHNAEREANKFFGIAGKRKRGILAAYERLLGMKKTKNEDFGEHSGELLNELGDTMKGKAVLARYLNARIASRNKLKDEAQRMTNIGRRHIANMEMGSPPSPRIANAYADMVDSLTRRKIRYETGLARAAAALVTPILQEKNLMTIKENYKQILNERIFNPNNPIGKIETGIRKFGALISPTRTARKEKEVADTRRAAATARQTRDFLTRYYTGGIVPSADRVTKQIAQDKRDAARDAYIEFQRTNPRFTKIDPHPFPTAGPYLGWYPHGGRRLEEKSNLLNEIGDTARG